MDSPTDGGFHADCRPQVPRLSNTLHVEDRELTSIAIAMCGAEQHREFSTPMFNPRGRRQSCLREERHAGRSRVISSRSQQRWTNRRLEDQHRWHPGASNRAT